MSYIVTSASFINLNDRGEFLGKTTKTTLFKSP